MAAIVAADVAGYSRLVSNDEEDTIHRLAAYREVYDDIIRQYGGRIVNTAGDSVLSEFESAVEAVRASIDIQDALRTRNFTLEPERKLQFRIGISIGDVIERNGDLLGDGVNIAARLEGLAEPGGICVSRSVHEAVANKISVPFLDLGERQVKNIPHPIHAFQVSFPQAASVAGSEAKLRRERVRWPLAAGLGGLLVLVAGIAFSGLVSSLLSMFGSPSRAPLQETVSSRPVPASPTATVSEAPATKAPSTPGELYQSARAAEGRGDQVTARRDYEALERLGLDYIDPGLRYASLLRVQDGRASAREAFASLASEKPTVAVALVHALQFDGVERQSRVAALAAAHPDYPPALHLLAEELSEDRLGRQPTIAERAMALDAERRFLKADADGRVSSDFLDLSVLDSWLDRAKARQTTLETLARSGAQQPSARFMRSNAGWTASVILPEPALAMAYRIGQQGEFKPAGESGAPDPRTGKPAPNTTIELDADQGGTTLWIRYTDAAGHETEPESIAFDPHAALLDMQRRALDFTSGAWLAFRPDMETLLYYTQLMSYRCAIRQATIGLDDAPVDRVLVMPPCDEREPYAIPSDAKPYISIPKATRSVSVRLIYADGTASDVKTIRR